MLFDRKDGSRSLRLHQTPSIAKFVCLILLALAALIFIRGRQVAANSDNNDKQNTYAGCAAFLRDSAVCT